MDDSVKGGGGLDVSVSFGRFENDTLSWEKWSSFSPNKYMEEIGSLSTPGSVAQKKAYFEAHYKKIAAKKAEEELEKEMSMGTSKQYEDYVFERLSENGVESDGERLVEGGKDELFITSLKNVAIDDKVEENDARSSEGDEHKDCSKSIFDGKMLVEEVECASDAVEEAKDVGVVNVDNPEIDVRIEAPQNESQCVVEEPPERKNVVKKQASATKKENPKLNSRSTSTKVITPAKKEKVTAVTKKKVVSATVKLPQPSTPKPAKSASMSTPVSTSKTKTVTSAPPKIKSSPMTRESKKTAPTSLHMSLNGPPQSFSALPTTRKSLIMESMGDKDIVKRAFKSFQSHTNVSVSHDKPNVLSTSTDKKMSSYHTPVKTNEGPKKKDTEKGPNQRSHSGSRSNPPPSVSHKSSSVSKKSPMPASSVTGLRSDEKAEKRKEFLKKLEAKSIARMAVNAQPGARSTVGVENGI